MGLLSWLKRPQTDAAPADLRSQLVSLVMRKDLTGLAAVVRDRRETIVAEFGDWVTVPMAMKEDPQLLEKYGEMLMAVARIVERDGDPSLVKRLEGDPADSPVETWNEQIAIAAALSDQERYADAAIVLSALANRLATLRGSAVDFYRPRVLGKLGIALYHAGDADRAREVTEQARDICQSLGDEDGVAAYTTNLQNMDQG
jgi:hypothetical protein